MESNEEWGFLQDDGQREAWDGYARIPEPGQNRPLDSFLVGKRLDHAALVRLGARLSAPNILAFAFDGGIKYRDVVTGMKWSLTGSTFRHLKIIPARQQPTDTAIICEGETDAARLTMLYEAADVAVMPAGATNWQDSYTPQVADYTRLLVGLDSDRAGETGWGKIKAACPHAVRFAPPAPAADWCEMDTAEVPIPDLPDAGESALAVLVPARELLALQIPESDSWFQDALLPVGGTAMLHGTFKSYKTWIALDMAAALAQGRPWACFENTEEPARVAYVNFEVPWAYYRARVALFASAADEPDLFGENFLSYSPLARPRLTAGDEKSEDTMIQNLLDAEAQVVFLDPVRRAMGYADMNAENEVRRILAFAERMTREGLTVVLLHHDNKASDARGGGDASGMTGSGAWAGDADTIISVSRPSGTERKDPRRNARFLLRNAPSPSGRGFELKGDGHVAWHGNTWAENTDNDDEGDDPF